MDPGMRARRARVFRKFSPVRVLVRFQLLLGKARETHLRILEGVA